MDFSKQEKTNGQNSDLLAKPPLSKRKDTLGTFGEADFSRPDSINQKSAIHVPKSPRIKAKQTLLLLDGSLDLSRPKDSINHMIPDLNTRSSKTKPLDNLKLIGDIDLTKKDHDRWVKISNLCHCPIIFLCHKLKYPFSISAICTSLCRIINSRSIPTAAYFGEYASICHLII